MKFSIIIPTYNRALILKRTLYSIKDQTFSKKNFEVLVIDDGSTDKTKNIIMDFIKNNSLNIKYFYQNHQGPGQARNLGINNSQGEIIVFVGDDTIFEKNLLANHNKTHIKMPNIIVLGMVFWDKSIEINNFMNYISPNGPQFNFGSIKNIRDAGWNHFYTCNISLPRKIISNLRFDSRYIYAAFEDIDFGLSLYKKGIKIFFNKEAIVYHSHFYNSELFYKRMINVGKSFVIFSDKYKKNIIDSLRLKLYYAPFNFFNLQLRLFVFFSKILSNQKLLKKINLKYHWYFNICYHYSLGIIKKK
ncbi:MAG: glycosyltransferase family 2 protein [Candidatus Kuenenbacteria bacterium]